MGPQRSDSSKKRRSSYTQSTKDGEAPKADMPAFKEELAQHGIIMDELKGDQFASEPSKALCGTMLSSQYEDPVYTVPFVEILVRLGSATQPQRVSHQ